MATRLEAREASRMALHHVALATRDLEATHAFYTEVMGFRLVKTEVAPTPKGGWARHVFYDTGGDGMIAFWDLHDDAIPADFDPAISTALGLPEWVNHLAFDAPTLDVLAERRGRALECGHTVAEIDHGWCRSIYVTDPNGILVEFCTTTVPLDGDDAREAHELLRAPSPPCGPSPEVVIHEPERSPVR
jgi:catechol 2,3-dioxygenase-like lactoylglutathione lyase family enzyme